MRRSDVESILFRAQISVVACALGLRSKTAAEWRRFDSNKSVCFNRLRFLRGDLELSAKDTPKLFVFLQNDRSQRSNVAQCSTCGTGRRVPTENKTSGQFLKWKNVLRVDHYSLWTGPGLRSNDFQGQFGSWHDGWRETYHWGAKPQHNLRQFTSFLQGCLQKRNSLERHCRSNGGGW